MNEFLVLMQSWDQVEKYISTANNASGESMKKFEAYQDSISGKIEGLKNSGQKFANTFTDSNFLKGTIDGATHLLNIITQIVDTVGVIPTILGGIGATALLKNLDRPKSWLHGMSLLSQRTLHNGVMDNVVRIGF